MNKKPARFIRSTSLFYDYVDDLSFLLKTMHPVRQYNPVIDPIPAPAHKRHMDMNGHDDSIGNKKYMPSVWTIEVDAILEKVGHRKTILEPLN